MYTENLDKLIDNITVSLQRMSLQLSMILFTKKIPYSLSDVNYLGFARDNLLVSLKYLMDSDLYVKERSNIIQPILSAIDNIIICTVKRLFVCLLVLDDIGIYDGASILAHLLYLGGLS